MMLTGSVTGEKTLNRDGSLMTACYRIFTKEIKLSDAYYFRSQTNKTKTRKQAYDEF